ncbi:hypothetical protein FYK55_15380 [Roseiconus nitratireducens]|uniref:Uncharacterized protein n=1 Tax=Roseiconus nitratireducens TaxID=2605748 RepID=A0A5M6DAF7_9BACT|nr:hypothetical protein [Roseiconus nitratireducens]KAA5542185.1 hypothetical protein FYK55_15380 [Roseiconus nitratireducens]
MTSDTPSQQPLVVSRIALIVCAIVLVISWIGSHSNRPSSRQMEGYAFGTWGRPPIQPLTRDSVESVKMGLKVLPIEGFQFFKSPSGPDPGNVTLGFVNRGEQLLGEIRRFDPERDAWPPRPDEFGQSLQLASESEPDADNGFLMRSDSRIQVQTILYDDAVVTWASPKKSMAWPLRVHIGRCELADQLLRITLYEVNSGTPVPVYDEGPIATLGNALRPQ